MSDTLTAEEKTQLAEMEAADAAPWAEGEGAAPPAPAAPAATETPAQTDAAPEGQAQPQQKTVPVEALQAERKRAQELSRQVAEMERRSAADMARLQERLDLLAQAAQATQPPPAPPAAPAPDPQPDPTTDPAGYLQWLGRNMVSRFEAMERRIAGTEQFAQRGQQQTQQQAETQRLIVWGQQAEAEFAATQPDYAAATAFLRDSRAKELAAAGITAPAEVQQLIAQDTLGLAAQARQRGVNFGRMLYGLAEARGYKAADPAAATATPAAATPAVDTTAAAMERATRGAQMAPGLPSGSAPRGEPSAQALANMSDAQFAAYLAKVQKDPAAMKAMFGE